ncbi:MAG: hypothetical protein A3E36_01055 [Candidatus Andersenbacteria bacterium RIFCSPHIGHO2_12_FULL_45_11b]|uniref:Uncharacterized protein n=1 Tax=Candidatus Andersenbacteria bacterium RIFCSPHIGHO2_12_FULL_45_11b TaxID=1797282 RepID=A0A1G1XBP0_9BACT|nr:MAG: hypothetical protein A3E36_01055 [Candidatus Andersenbacteria bacterium RIFCSPHIGHO2_12_FULL_45_11b]
MAYPIRGTRRERTWLRMQALLELSGKSERDLTQMLRIVNQAADSATAIFEVIQFLDVQESALQEKWSKYVSQVWFELHPKIPSALNLHIMSHDVMFSDALMEAHGLLQELAETPARAGDYLNAGILSGSEEHRISDIVRVFGADPMRVRRTSAILEELRLIREVKGRVCVVKSRFTRFQALPLSAQYYLLWHIDMYHLDWKEYMGNLQSHMAVFQQYLPMIWEMLEHTACGQTHSVDEFAWHVVRLFRPLWQQENALGLYEQSALQSMVDQWLIGNVFARYGLIEYGESASEGAPRSFAWTRAGVSLLHSERTIKLPCAIDVLE